MEAEKGVFDGATPWPPPTTETYLSHGELGGFPTNPTPFTTLTTTPLFTLLNTSDPIQMAYFNNINDATFYPIPDISGELGFYPFAEQASATEEIGMVNPTFPDWWSMTGQPGPVACSPANFWTTGNGYGECQSNPFVDQCLTREPLDQVDSTTSYATSDNGYGQPQYSGHSWPAVDQQVQHHHTNFSSWDVSNASAPMPETLAMLPAHSSGERRSYFEPPRNLIFTNHKQFSLTIGGPTRAGSLLATPMWKIVEHNRHCTICPTSHRKMCAHYIRPMPVQLGPSYCQRGGSSHMECPTPTRTSM